MKTTASPYRTATPTRDERLPVRVCLGCCHEDHVGRCRTCGKRCVQWQMQRFIAPQGAQRAWHAAVLGATVLAASGAYLRQSWLVAAVAASVALVLYVMLVNTSSR